jgi:RND family efflux transporter MFP subunit
MMGPRRVRFALLVSLSLSSIAAFPAVPQALAPRGITEPWRDANVGATEAGIVTAVRAREGQFVHEGETVIELDGALEALEVERRKLVADSTVEVDAARARVQTLKIDLDGTRRLHETTRSVSEEDLQKKELEYSLAEAELDRLLVAEQREQIEFRIAEAQRTRKSVVAPFDGVIVQVLLEVGEGCTQQQPLFRIVDTRRCRLVVHMEQAPALKMKPGSKVALRIQEADGAVGVQGTVEFVSPLVDASSGLREVRILFENPDGRIHPGVPGTIAAER